MRYTLAVVFFLERTLDPLDDEVEVVDEAAVVEVVVEEAAVVEVVVVVVLELVLAEASADEGSLISLDVTRRPV